MSYLYTLRTVIRSKIFWLAVVLNLLFIFFNSDFLLSLDTPFLDLMEQIQAAYWPGMAAFVAPVIAALPCVTRFHEEKTSGGYRMSLLRHGKLAYAVHHVLTGMLSGFLVMLFSLAAYSALMYVVSFFIGQPVVYTGIVNAFGDGETPNLYYDLVEDGKNWLVYLFHCLFLCFYGMVWSGIGVAASVFIKNKNFALIFPLFVKRLMEYFPDRFTILTPYYLRFEGIGTLPAGGFLYAGSYLLTVFILGTLCMSLGLSHLLKKQG